MLSGPLLSACGVYEVRPASADRIEVEVLPDLAVLVVVHGTLGDGCTRVGDVTQSQEVKTFLVTIGEVCNQPFGTACRLAISTFREEVWLETRNLEPGPYTVNVNGVVETFTWPSKHFTTVCKLCKLSG